MNVRSIVSAFVVAVASAHSAFAFTVVEQKTLRTGDLIRTDTVVQVDANPLNRFTMHRVVRDAPTHTLRGPVMLLPALGQAFAFYEYNEDANYNDSTAGYLAHKGFDVWGYSPRESTLTAGTCGTSVDCTVMNTWGIQSFVDDAQYIRGQITGVWPNRKPAIGGYSLGGMAGLAVINQYPHQYAGYFSIEGSLTTDNAAIQAYNTPYCANLNGALSAGAYWDDQSLPGLKLLAVLAQTDPNGASLVPGFPPGTTNRQALIAVLSTTQPAPTYPSATFIQTAGDIATATFTFAEDTRVFGSLGLSHDVAAIRVLRDVICGLAGETTFTANLANYKKPVLLIRAGRGFGDMMAAIPSLVGSSSIKQYVYPAHGHIDVFSSASHKQLMERKLTRWLRRQVF